MAMPSSLAIALSAACVLLLVDAVGWSLIAESPLDYVVVAINLAVVALLAATRLRKPIVTVWVRTTAWIWALFAAVALFFADFSDPLATYQAIELMLELGVFLSLSLALRSRAVLDYLGESSA
jgi:hypothetical protein